MERNWNLFSIYPFPALLYPLPLMPFTTEEITGCANEAAKSANKAPRNPPFFILSFTLSVTPLIKTLESSNDFIILLISFEINKVNLLPCSNSSFSAHFYIKFIYCIWI